MKKIKKSILSGFLGGFILIALFFLLLISMDIFNYKIVIINKKISPIENYSEKNKIIKQLEEDGVVLTPQEYTNNLVNYYNALLTILTALLIVFSLISYFHIRSISRSQISEVFKDTFKDSKDFEKNVLEAVFGKADAKFATIEQTDDIQESIQNIDVEEIMNRIERLESIVKRDDDDDGQQIIEEN